MESVKEVNKRSVTNDLVEGMLCLSKALLTPDIEHVSNDPEDNII